MRVVTVLILCLITLSVSAQTPVPATKPPEMVYLLKPAHIFDGESAAAARWLEFVLVRGEKIEGVGPAAEIKARPEAKVISCRE